MLIKAADPKAPQVDILTALLGRPDVDARTRKLIEEEVRTTRAGESNERDAAYEIDFHLRDHRNLAVIHDLRIEHEGRVAQIDHLIMNRLLHAWVCESKSYKEGVEINEYGEWSRYYKGRPIGIESPIAQIARQIDVLQTVFASGRVTLPKRISFTIRPELKSVVIIANSATIRRPKPRVAAGIDGLDRVVKLDKLIATLEKDMDEKEGAALVAEVAMRAVKSETLEALMRQVAALHRPMSFDWPAKFGLTADPPVTQARISPRARGARPAMSMTGPLEKTRSICDECGIAVSAGVVSYCETYKDRFGGRILCMRCQRMAERATGTPS